MGSFSIAFDTIVVGALALPWIFLVIHLFFPENESRISGLVDWVNKQNQPAVAGLLLFAMAYPLGSVVSRIAQDCFDDDDLYLEATGRVFRVGVTMTQTSILTHVYCQEKDQGLISQTLIDSLNHKPGQSETNDSPCLYKGQWLIPRTHKHLSQSEGLAGDVFHVQEGALLLQGTDKNERLRQFHHERMVLRGAAFDGVVAFSLCLFWWNADRKSRLRYALPLVYLVPGLIALHNHFLTERAASNPPLLEFTLLVLALADWYLLWQSRSKGKGVPAEHPAQNARGQIRPAYLLLALFLTVTAFLGWQATEALYDQQVIYSSYKIASESPAKPATPNPK
jgi:hypothetical protein